MKGPKSEFIFDFAVSFAGEDRPIAEKIASKLRKARGVSVFYDYYFKSELLGKKIGREFSVIYGPATRFFVPLISKYYVSKDYTDFEWTVAKEEASKRDYEFILPIRLDDSKLIGLQSDVDYLDWRKDSLESIVETLLKKLVVSAVTKSTVWVATVGLVVDEAVKNWRNIPRFQPGTYPGMPQSYADLCDWFEQDLHERLHRAGLRGMEFLEDSRNGETLSVRFKFNWSPPDQPLDFGPLDWWEVLEVAPLKDIYPSD